MRKTRSTEPLRKTLSHSEETVRRSRLPVCRLPVSPFCLFCLRLSLSLFWIVYLPLLCSSPSLNPGSPADVVYRRRSARFTVTEEMGLVTFHLHLQTVHHPNKKHSHNYGDTWVFSFFLSLTFYRFITTPINPCNL